MIKVGNLLSRYLKDTKTVDVGLFQKPESLSRTLERTPAVERFESVADYSIKDKSLAVARMLDCYFSAEPKFYRIVSQEELMKVLSGEKIVSHRECYDGLYTDITTNPFYSKISRQGKFRLEFNNDKNAFANSGRIRSWAPENSHYQIIGPYDKTDVKAIAYFDGEDVIDLGSVDELLSKLPK